MRKKKSGRKLSPEIELLLAQICAQIEELRHISPELFQSVQKRRSKKRTVSQKRKRREA